MLVHYVSSKSVYGSCLLRLSTFSNQTLHVSAALPGGMLCEVLGFGSHLFVFLFLMFKVMVAGRVETIA